MERQRSFSIKTTKFMVFVLTISSSIVFLIFFSIWAIKATPSVHQQTHFHFNNPTVNVGLKPSTVQTLTDSTTNFSSSQVKNTILIDTHLRKLENSSGFANVSRIEELQKKESGTAESGVENFENGTGQKISILISSHIRKAENVSGFAEGSIFKGLESKGNVSIVNRNLTNTQQNVSDTLTLRKEVSSGERIMEKKSRICDITKGKWVFDESYPLYTNASCPFIDEGFDCVGNGRLDKDYMKWRWQPQDCDIPRFNATKMLQLIRGKRLVFVGDSINRNQWESILCLLMGAIKDPKRVYETRGRRITKEKGDYSFKFVDYKCTVEYHVTHFLVHESKARVGKKRVQTLRIDTMDRGSSRWKGADILVFNTAHWWNHYKTKAGINYYQEGDQVYPHLDVSTAFRRALMAWASWVDKHVNPGRTRVFFQSSAPSHFRGGQWNSGGHCKEATQPLNETSSVHYSEKNSIAEEIIRQMKTPVTFLNVTSMSEYRIDGHPSAFGKKSRKSYSSSVQDCSHWCLPGVPDTWNELLFSHLQFKRREIL